MRPTRRSATSRSCWRRSEASGADWGIALHVLHFRPGSAPDAFRGRLTLRERSALTSLPEHRTTEWAASRIAAKEAVRRLVDSDVAPSAIVIQRDRSGVPTALVPGRRVPLSLSHSRGCAVAAANLSSPVGVDVEALPPIPEDFSRYFLRPDEKAALEEWEDRPTALLAAWTVKEAVLKAFGRGLTVPLKSVTIRSIDPDGRVDVAFEEGEVGAECWQEDGAVVAVARVGSSEIPPISVSRSEIP